jgi:hypothetical protein
MNKYSITYNNKNNEKSIIETILFNNNYPLETIQQKQKPRKKNSIYKKKCVTFTYFGPEVRKITKLFKNTDIGIAFKPKIILSTY